MLRPLSVLLFATAALAVVASPARACSFFGCLGSAILPESGSLPANHLELLWIQPSDPFPGGLPGEISLYRLDGDRRAELETRQTLVQAVVHIVPVQAVPEGSELLVIRVDPCSDGEGAKTYENRFRVGPQAPAPTALGRLTAQYGTGEFSLWVTSGECKRIYRTAFAELSLALSESAQPLADAMRYWLLVDGQLYRGSEFYGLWPHQIGDQRTLHNSVLGPGKERVHTLCEGDFQANGAVELAPGSHRVRMIGELNDGTRIESDEITIELQCPPRNEPDPVADAGSAPNDGGGTTGQAPDAAQPSADHDDMLEAADDVLEPASSPATTLDEPPTPSDSAAQQSDARRAKSDPAATCAVGRSKRGTGATAPVVCAIGLLTLGRVRRRARLPSGRGAATS